MNNQLFLEELEKIIKETKREILELEDIIDKENSINKENEF